MACLLVSQQGITSISANIYMVILQLFGGLLILVYPEHFQTLTDLAEHAAPAGFKRVL
jgi:hypothetical protein